MLSAGIVKNKEKNLEKWEFTSNTINFKLAYIVRE